MQFKHELSNLLYIIHYFTSFTKYDSLNNPFNIHAKMFKIVILFWNLYDFLNKIVVLLSYFLGLIVFYSL